MRNLILIIGCGRLGSNIANTASFQGHNVVMIDPDEESFSHLSELFTGITVKGEGSNLEVLEEAHATSAKEAIITTGNDNTNILIANICKEFFLIPHIYVRLDNPELGVLLEGKGMKTIYPFELSINKFYEMYNKEEEK